MITASTRWLLKDGCLPILKLVVSITLLSRGWLTYQWDSPIRGLFWSESHLAPILESWFGLDWNTYSSQSDRGISTTLNVVGLILILSTIVPWLPIGRRIQSLLLTPAILALLLDALARWVESGTQLGAAMEKSLQWGTPIAFLIAINLPDQKRTWSIIVKTLAAFTFIGHGLYAAGFHPVPWNYQSMTRDLTHLSETGALHFLKIAGYLDFAVAISIFIPKIAKLTLLYMVFWGAATAAARFLTHPTQLDPWLVETTVRTAHWAIPLLLVLQKGRNSK